MHIEEPVPRTKARRWQPYAFEDAIVEALPRPAPRIRRDFHDVLQSRRSKISGPIDLTRIAELLWYAAGTKGYASEGCSGLPVEWRCSPSAGALHPIQIVAISENEGPRWYDAMHHAFVRPRIDPANARTLNTSLVRAVLGDQYGYTLWLIADMEKADAAYENCETLVLRDAGCLISTVCLCAEWLGISTCAIGLLGKKMVGALQLPEPKFQAMGAIQVSLSASR